MYTHSSFFIVTALLVPVFLASISAACLPDCIPSENEGDKAAAKLGCLLLDGQQPTLPDNK